MSYKDFNHIKTDFDGISAICRIREINIKYLKRYMKLYRLNDFLSDMQYYNLVYLKDSNIHDLIFEVKRMWA